MAATEIITEKQEQAENNTGGKDILALIARENKKMKAMGEAGLSFETMRDQIMTFLGAGHDTTATGVAWTLHLLSTHPEIQSRLREEIKDYMAETDSEDELAEDFEGLDMDLDYEEIERSQQERERRRRHRQKLTINLGRTTSQQRIHALGTEGLRHSVLWHCALRMLAVARTILLDYGNRPRQVEDELIAARKSRLAALAQTSLAQSPSPLHSTGAIYGVTTHYVIAESRERHWPHPIFDPTESLLSVPVTGPPPPVIPESSARRRDRRNRPPRGALISSFRFDPESSTFDVMFPAMHHPSEDPTMQTNPPPVAAAMPNYPHVIQEDSEVEHVSFKNGTANSNSHNHAAAASSPSAAARNGKKVTTVLATDNYRSKYQFGLPLHLWQRIIVESIGVNSILHPDQQTKIIEYAASWGALEAEMSINGASENQQMWKILDSIDCFVYRPLS